MLFKLLTSCLESIHHARMSIAPGPSRVLRKAMATAVISEMEDLKAPKAGL